MIRIGLAAVHLALQVLGTIEKRVTAAIDARKATTVQKELLTPWSVLLIIIAQEGQENPLNAGLCLGLQRDPQYVLLACGAIIIRIPD